MQNQSFSAYRRPKPKAAAAFGTASSGKSRPMPKSSPKCRHRQWKVSTTVNSNNRRPAFNVCSAAFSAPCSHWWRPPPLPLLCSFGTFEEVEDGFEQTAMPFLIFVCKHFIQFSLRSIVANIVHIIDSMIQLTVNKYE
jgi:hypothetical protein